MQCNAGYTSNEERTYCIQCEKGYYNPNIGSNFRICPNGTISNYKGAKYCTICPKGSTSNYNHTRCEACPAGYYAPSLSTPACLPCKEGYYSSLPGSSSCIQCSPGKTSKEASSKCYDIEILK